jgi:hypothetical protein
VDIQFKVKPSNRWTTRGDDGAEVASFETHVNKDLDKKADKLIWYVNMNSLVPVRIQLLVLWFMRLWNCLP